VHLRRSHRRRKFGSRPLRPGRAVVQSRRLPHLPGTRSPADPLGPSPERGRAADTGHRASLEGQSVAPPMQCALRRPRTISGDASGHTAPRFGPAEAGRSSWQSNICALPLRWLTGASHRQRPDLLCRLGCRDAPRRGYQPVSRCLAQMSPRKPVSDAAMAAGVDLREAFSVRELVQDGDRVSYRNGFQRANECSRNDPMMRADAPTLTVNAKKAPKSCVAAMLVMNRPGILL
jgi:hypothetical protein